MTDIIRSRIRERGVSFRDIAWILFILADSVQTNDEYMEIVEKDTTEPSEENINEAMRINYYGETESIEDISYTFDELIVSFDPNFDSNSYSESHGIGESNDF